MATITTSNLWMIHGVSMGIAWGVLVPLAIGSVFLRNRISLLNSNARWLRIHLCLAILAAILTGLGYAAAVLAENRDDDGQFEENERFDDDFHSVVGIAVLIMVFIQGIVGFIRPKPLVTPDNNDNEEVFEDEEKHTQGSNEVDDSAYENGNTVETLTKSKVCSIRRVWEWTHRFFGILLVCLAWFNCHSGIFLFAEYYGPIDNLLKLFWCVTASISGIIFVAGCALSTLH